MSSTSATLAPPSAQKAAVSARRAVTRGALLTALPLLFIALRGIALYDRLPDSNGLSLARQALIRGHRWEGAPPRWCARLIARPRERPRTSSIYDCRRGRFGAVCEDGEPRFFSQYNQDIWTWKQHWRHLRRRGVYVDIAANEPVRISNSYFYDACLQWRGLCVEAHPAYVPLLARMRSCDVMPTCVGAKAGKERFRLDAGSSGVVRTNKNKDRKNVSVVSVECVATAAAMQAARIRRIDMMSLDVEGHEEVVLEGVDWGAVRINVIVVETVSNRSLDILLKQGYRQANMPLTREEKAVDGALFSDHVFLHRSVLWGRPV